MSTDPTTDQTHPTASQAPERASTTATTPNQVPPQPVEAAEQDWDAAADWAQRATFNPGAFIPTEADPLGPSAGADLLRRAGVGRPPLDPATPAGQSSRSRPVRLGRDLDHQLQDHLAALTRQGAPANASEVIRTALREHLQRHQSQHRTA